MSQEKKRQVTQSDARDRILAAARRLFAANGYTGTSISMIAKASGVLSGSIYWAFPSKEELFITVLTEASDEWRARFTPDADRTPLATFQNDLTQFTAGYVEVPEFVRLLMVVATEHNASAPKIMETALNIRRSWRDIIEAALLPELSDYEEDAARALAKRISRLALQLLDGIFMSLQIEREEDHEVLIAEYMRILRREIQHGVDQLASGTLPPSG